MGLAIGTVSSGTTSSGTDHTVTLPASISAGDILVVFFTQSSNDSLTGWPAGWTELIDTRVEWTIQFAIAWRRADGGEGASITVTSASSSTGAYVVYRVTGAHASSAPEAAASATGETANPDPPSITATWGSEENLFLAAWGTAARGTTGYPTGYALSQTTVNGCAGAGKLTTAATDNPGTATIAVADVWGAGTVVIRPAAGGGFVPYPLSSRGARGGHLALSGGLQ